MLKSTVKKQNLSSIFSFSKRFFSFSFELKSPIGILGFFAESWLECCILAFSYITPMEVGSQYPISLEYVAHAPFVCTITWLTEGQKIITGRSFFAFVSSISFQRQLFVTWKFLYICFFYQIQETSVSNVEVSFHLFLLLVSADKYLRRGSFFAFVSSISFRRQVFVTWNFLCICFIYQFPEASIFDVEISLHFFLLLVSRDKYL